jgi:hypothetical protein
MISTVVLDDVESLCLPMHMNQTRSRIYVPDPKGAYHMLE